MSPIAAGAFAVQGAIIVSFMNYVIVKGGIERLLQVKSNECIWFYTELSMIRRAIHGTILKRKIFNLKNPTNP